MPAINFKIEKKLGGKLGRAGVLETPSGKIETPSFVVVGTKATVKALSPEQVKDLGTQVVLANTYHLYLEPGDEILKKAGGLKKFMNWNGPTMTDSGGFQVFSLGAAFGTKLGKISNSNSKKELEKFANSESEKSVQTTDCASEEISKLAKIDEEGVTFKSPLDGRMHRFTPEKSVEIQHNIGADMIFAFDECTSPEAPKEYQIEAMARTHRWAERCLDYHRSKKENSEKQALFGIVQGGRFEDLRKESAREISKINSGGEGFDGFGIGGSFEKEDMNNAVRWVNEILPEEKPKHLLGIGEPADLFGAVENGCDLFDCVAPTRMARNGALYTSGGRININNAKFVKDFSPIEKDCRCYACKNFTRAYLAHLFRAKEMFAATLASIHNLYFINHLVKKIRGSVLDGNFSNLKEEFLKNYYH